MRRKFLILTTVVLLCFTLFAGLTACAFQVNDFSVIVTKTVYETDEPFDFSTAKLKVFYGDGAASDVALSQSMLSGFDTSISGERSATVTFGGKVKHFAYIVLGSIETATRIAADRGAGGECVVRLKNAEFFVYAVTFTLQGDTLPDRITALAKGWTVQTKGIETGISVILYPENGQPIKENTMLVNFLCPTDATYTLSGICVAADKREYALPDAKLAPKVESY